MVDRASLSKFDDHGIESPGNLSFGAIGEREKYSVRTRERSDKEERERET